MKRNKWKTAYDEKCEELLGMKATTATAKLERMWLFDFVKKAGYRNCYHCGFPIKDEPDFSVEHMNSWGGNKARNICADVGKFWNLENLRASHKRCNVSAAKGGTGFYKYIGVHPARDNRPNRKKCVYARASISVNSKDVTLGNYDHDKPEKAAIAYDLGLMIFFKGIGKLNFEYLRETYEKELKNYNTASPAFWVIRSGPIKRIVEELYPLVKKDENSNEGQISDEILEPSLGR